METTSLSLFVVTEPGSSAKTLGQFRGYGRTGTDTDTHAPSLSRATRPAESGLNSKWSTGLGNWEKAVVGKNTPDPPPPPAQSP